MPKENSPIGPNQPVQGEQSRSEDVSFQIMPNEGVSANETLQNTDSLNTPAGLPQEEHHPFNSKAVYIIIGILILAAAGAAAYFLLGNKTAEPQAAVSELPKAWLKTNFNIETCDNQSVCGDAADPDNDGLSNYDEFKVRKGTDPHNPDTDGDGLSDGDEAHIYNTEPAIKFTLCLNNTGIACQYDDGTQIANDYDPLTPGEKTTDTRKQKIADDTEQYKLHEPTPTSLQKLRTASTAPQAKSYTVTIENGKFSPDSLTLNVGDTVVWLNKDEAMHQIATPSLPTLNSPELTKNTTFSVQFPLPGTYSYFDKLNNDIKGSITVK